MIMKEHKSEVSYQMSPYKTFYALVSCIISVILKIMGIWLTFSLTNNLSNINDIYLKNNAVMEANSGMIIKY